MMRHSLIPAVLLLAASAGAAPWAVSDAPLRFDYTVEARPEVPTAGILVMLPDGGLLPAPSPRPVVLDGAGKPVEFDILWHNPQEGMGLVVLNPPTPAFSVYVGRQSRPSKNERVPFTPGPLFYVKLGQASLEAATRLPSGFPPGRDAIMGPVPDIGQMENPFGPNHDFSGWFSAWLQIAKPGRYYFATISDEGSMFRIDGKTVAEWPGQHPRAAGAKGQFGGALELTAGPHQVDYFYFNLAGPSEAQLAWRLPGTTNSLPVMVPASAYLRSGHARLTGVAEKDGGPVAAPQAACENYFWFGEQPDNLFRLTPRFAAANPSNTVYEWKLDDGAVVKDTNVLWIFEGSEPRTITLTARSGNRSSTAAWTVKLNTTPPAASVDNAFHRQAYRTALLNRCKAAPPPAHPAANWPPGLWQVLVNVVEPFKGQALFDELFERARDDMAKALSPADLGLLQDLFMDNLRYSDKVRAASWLDKFEKEEKNVDRKREWTLEKIELALYQAADTNLARRLATELAAAAPGSEAGVLASVRLGDIEALAGRFDEARALYARAQAASPRKSGALSAQAPAAPAGAPGLARSRDELKKNPDGGGLARSKEALDEERTRRATQPKTGTTAFVPKVDLWKAEAVRGGAYYETIRDLLQKGYLREARQELRNWELELPTEKLGGEYPVAEAEFFMAVRDYARVRVILGGYRRAVDVSPFMPKAMGMELDCLQRLGLADEAAALAKIILRRFPGHPVADQARLAGRLTTDERNAPNPGLETP